MARAHIIHNKPVTKKEINRVEERKHIPSYSGIKAYTFAECICCDRVYYAVPGEYGAHWVKIKWNNFYRRWKWNKLNAISK